MGLGKDYAISGTYAEPLHGVQDEGHGLDRVGVDNRLEHQPLLQAVVTLHIPQSQFISLKMY